VAYPVERAHDVAAAIERSDRFGDEHIVPSERAMRAKRIGPDRASIAVDKQMGILFRHAERLLCGNRHAALGCAGDPADKLLSRALLLPSGRRRRARGQSERERGEETRHSRTIIDSADERF